MIQGVDVSSYQGPPSSWVGAAGDIQWVAVKLTEFGPGSIRYVNPDAPADWAYVAEKKLGRIGYMFAHPSASPAESVAFFVSEIKALGLRDSDGVMLDLEVTDGLGPGQVNAWAAEVMADLHRSLNRMPILYTFISFAEAGNTASLGKYPLWIADPSSPQGKPFVPPPWTTWTIHQYSISGPIDRDVAKFATVAAMEEAFGVAPSPPKPQTGNLGGSVVSGVTAMRWGNGNMVVAGIDGLGHVAIRRYDGATGKWGVWWNPTGTIKVAGPPGLVSWGETYGQLFYATQSGQVIEMATEDAGRTWK